MKSRLPLTIGIATKNRPEHLAATVAQLAEIVPDAAELLLIDDGSDQPVSLPDTGAVPFPVRLIRHSKSVGLIASRNEIARECRTEFILSCDDDSYPITGSMGMTVHYLNGHPELIALSFPYLEGQARRPMNPSASTEPYPVRQFIGCANLMRVDYFLQLGGYWEWLVQQNEERDLCYRAIQRGWGVAHFPDVTFYHDYASKARNWNRHEYYTMRNEMAVELRHAPLAVVIVKLARNLVLAIWWSVRRGRSGSLRGYWNSFFAPADDRQSTTRISLKQFRSLAAYRWS